MIAKLFSNKKSLIDDEDIPKERLQALVDGIFAIAMTLLVFSVHVPDVAETASAGDLLKGLQVLLPSIATFLVSFVILGMFWVAHHTEFHYIKKLDHRLIWMNIFYLLFVCLVPFSAELLGDFLLNQTAIVFYGINLMAMVLIHAAIWNHVTARQQLVIEYVDQRINKLVRRISYFAVAAYFLAILLSFWNPIIALVIYAIVPLPYIFGWAYKLV